MQSIILFSFRTISLALAFTINICGEFCLDLLTFVLSMSLQIPHYTKINHIWKKTQLSSQNKVYNIFPVNYKHSFTQGARIAWFGSSVVKCLWVVKLWHSIIPSFESTECWIGMPCHPKETEQIQCFQLFSIYIDACGLKSWKVNQFPWSPPPVYCFKIFHLWP